MDKKLTIIAQKALYDNIEIGEHVSVELPEISRSTQEVTGAGVMGTLDVPSTAQIESMELSVSTSGMGKGRAMLLSPGQHRLEFRLVQDHFTPEAGVKPQGVKIFATGTLKSGGGGSIENASAVESDATFEVSRYEEYIDGVETLLIDKLNYIYRVMGVDYAQDIRGFLE